MKVLVVGCGNMGYAIVSAWLKSGKLALTNCVIVEPNEELRKRANALGVACFASAKSLPETFNTDLIMLAVKPQVMGQVLQDYVEYAQKGCAFLSIAAGLPIAFFEQNLGVSTPIMRCMPNTPAAIGQGMMVTCVNQHFTDQMQHSIHDLFAENGVVTTLNDETQMDAVTAVSGSGPAYVFHMIECLAAAGENAGLTSDTAMLLAKQTVAGAGLLAFKETADPATLRQQVTSPNGTTAAALDVLMSDDRFARLIDDAVGAAKARSIELGK